MADLYREIAKKPPPGWGGTPGTERAMGVRTGTKYGRDKNGNAIFEDGSSPKAKKKLKKKLRNTDRRDSLLLKGPRHAP